MADKKKAVITDVEFWSKEVQTMQKDVQGLKSDMGQIRADVREILQALKGNDMSGDKGIVKKIQVHEERLDKVEKNLTSKDTLIDFFSLGNVAGWLSLIGLLVYVIFGEQLPI